MRARIAGLGVVVAVLATGLAALGGPRPAAAAADSFRPMVPTRLLDTRMAGQTPLGSGEVRQVPIAGRAGIPGDAIAVALNVTVTAPSAGSFLTVYPAGLPLPTSSNVNFGPGQTVPNMVLVGLGAGGRIAIFNARGSAHVLVDVAGWFSGGFVPVAPRRLVDTRATDALGTGEVRDVPIAGRAGVPADAVAIAVNVTVTAPTAGGFVSVFPSGTPFPGTSNVNFGPGQTVANLALVGLGANGDISLRNSSGASHVIVDLAGWFADGFHPITPARLADTRGGLCGIRVGQGERRSVAILDRSGLPASGMTAVALNVTVVNPTIGGWLTVYPKGSPRPGASNLNFARSQTVANSVTTGLGPDGAVTVYNAFGAVDVVLDVTGWFEGTSGAQPLFDCAVVPPDAAQAPAWARIGPGLAAVGPGGVPAGRYVAPGGPGCSWQRLRGLSGAPGDVAATGTGPARVIVDLLAGDAGFWSAGCGVWAAHGPPAATVTAVGDGDWVVSEELAPGVYQSSAAAPCRWEHLLGFSGAAHHDLDDGMAFGITWVEIAPSEVGFRSRGCGVWRWVGAPLD
jgi:hypothetical protein